MRLASVRIQNYRCLHDIELVIDDLTVLIGANGTGKSSVLRALRWFFEGGPLEPDDVCGQDPDSTVSVSATFTQFSQADREALGSYAAGDSATFWRTWSQEHGEKLTGRGLAYPPFERVREHTRASDLRQAYLRLREEDASLGLPGVRSADAAREVMKEWESRNDDRLEQATSSATHLFGVAGQPKLAGRFDYVFVPAVTDAEQQTQDARGTLLQQLLTRSTADRNRADERLKVLRDRMAEEVGEVVREEHEAALEELSGRVTSALSAYVSAGSVTLEARPPELKVPPLQVGMRVADGGVETDVGRQGHGFQRALIMAAVQELARVEEAGDAPALFLSIEEPELYQHPTQARHFARTLAKLTRRGEGGIQVAYATHSEHFIDPSRYERLRRLRKRSFGGSHPVTEVSSAAASAVADRLEEFFPPDQIAGKIAITLRRTLAEAVFAHAVLLVEGQSDDAFFSGVADREGGFDALGIAVVSAGSKSRLAMYWAILAELGVPTFVVFDGDGVQEARLRAKGRRESDIRSTTESSARWNRNLLELLGAPAEDWPGTTVRASYATFHDCLETELKDGWPQMLERIQILADESGDRREKPDDLYRQAAFDTEGEVPGFAAEVLTAVKSLR